VSNTSDQDVREAIVTAVSNELRSYADRGIFSNFSVKPGRKKAHRQFHFQWLTAVPFQLKLNPDMRVLELTDLLPAVPFRSDMDQAFRTFLTKRCAESIPEHRRLDGNRFHFKCSNRNQKLSVAIAFAAADAGAAVRTAINLIHEVFNNFLQEGPYQNYMVEVFNVAEE